jgi:anti-anti-sigma factor
MESWPERASDSDGKGQATMTPGENQTTADSGAGIEIVRAPAVLDLTTSEGVAAQGCAAIARLARLVLLDLTGLSFCDARGLSAFVRIANHADAARCRFGLIAPRPPVAKILRISCLDSRMPVFATTGDALALLTATAAPMRLPSQSTAGNSALRCRQSRAVPGMSARDSDAVITTAASAG